MRTLHQVFIVTPAESLELVAIDYQQDKGNDPKLHGTIQAIPIVALKINIYEQTYRDSSDIDLIAETKYVSPKGEVDLEEFTTVQTISHDNTLACVSVVALRTKGSDLVSLLESSRENSWIDYCPWEIPQNRYTTYSAGESHPVLVELDQLLKDLEATFPAITEFNTGDQEAGA
jgi:hypothetical protein